VTSHGTADSDPSSASWNKGGGSYTVRPAEQFTKLRKEARVYVSECGVFSQSFFHGTTADLKPGGLIVVGCQSNFLEGKSLSWVYFAATLDAAI
jgi:Rifampin ADP-ribosyl transferase